MRPADNTSSVGTAAPDPWALPAFEPGTVWLVGAGPGDPGLLTQLAVHGLRCADVIVHDALVGDAILAGLPHGVERIDVGKRAGKAKARQDAICALLVALAQAGRRVLRLKGGDPFVFGRGGEEAVALAGAGVPFRVVPGITAGIGGLAQAGIPATQRGMNTAVTLLTGHDSKGAAPVDLDWHALAHGAPVLVFYMALRTIETIAARLIAEGLPPMTPVAIVSNASLPQQTVIRAPLARAAREARRLAANSPAIIVIGEVARLHDVLSPWQLTGLPGEVGPVTTATATIA